MFINRSREIEAEPVTETLTYVFERYPEYKGIETFIETGTLVGTTTLEQSHNFKQVHTVELNEHLYRKAVGIFANIRNVKCYFSDSAEILPILVRHIRERCVFFLDAHWSGDSSVN